MLAATTNSHKLSEIARIMMDIPIELKCLKDYSGYPKVIEDGKTFEENARKKAQKYFEFTGIPVFADDSGLVVPALGNEPGIRSARYAGEEADYNDNNQLLIRKIIDIPTDQRVGIFVCTICYIDENHEEILTGTSEGIILDELRGQEGFGYDPLFFVPDLGKTFAEISMSEKNKISHRGRAIIRLKDFLKNEILDQ